MRPRIVCAIATAGGLLVAPAIAGAWGQVVTVTPRDGADYRAADVAQNPAGDVVAAWVRSPAGAAAGTGRVFVATRAGATGRWTSPAAVSAGGVSAPAVAMNARGWAAVAWPLRDRVQVAVRAGRAAPWRTLTAVRAGGPVTDVAVAVGSSGAMSLMWNERRGSAYRVRMAEDRTGKGRWILRGSSVGARGRPALAVTPRMGGAAIWVENGRVRAARNPGGVFERSVQLSDADAQGTAGVAVSPGGVALGAWGASLPGGTVVISAADRRARGGWRALGDIGLGARPSVAVNAAGIAAVAWPVADDDGRSGIEGVARGADGEWRTLTIVRRTECGCQYTVAATAVDGAGALHVSWSREGGRGPAVGVISTREAGGGPWRHRGVGPQADIAPRLSTGAGRGAAAIWTTPGDTGAVRVRVRGHRR